MVAQPMVPITAMIVEEQKILGLFLRLAPLRFSGATREYAYEFLTSYHERLYTLGLVVSRGADYMDYQIDGPA